MLLPAALQLGHVSAFSCISMYSRPPENISVLIHFGCRRVALVPQGGESFPHVLGDDIFIVIKS